LVDGGGWKAADLKESGIKAREMLREAAESAERKAGGVRP
jgi:hypothetical protein